MAMVKFEKFTKIIFSAYYYQQIVKEHNITFSEDTIFEDIKKFPLLTKEIIRNHFDELHKYIYSKI